MARNDSGIGKDSPISSSQLLVITCFIVMALYNVVELNFIVFLTFKRRSGLYFWSFMVATWGIALFTVGFMLKNFKVVENSGVYVTIIVVGWCAMVTGQSVVLYSRLHLMVQSRTVLRAVLAMIIVNAIVCHVPIIVMVYGANSDNPGPYIAPYSVYEKVQVSIFFIQELIISGLYIYETAKFLRLGTLTHGKEGRKLLIHLFFVNAVIIILDITILGLEYAGMYSLQTTYKALVYSVKLKLEFSILNKLVDLAKRTHSSVGIYTHSSERIALDDIGANSSDLGRRNTRTTMRDMNRDDVGYHASIRTGQNTQTDKDAEVDIGSVIMTTEVFVHRNEPLIGREDGRASHSLEPTPATTSEFGLNTTEEHPVSPKTQAPLTKYSDQF